MLLDRITINPDIMGGKPCIRGMRFPVSRVLGMLAGGESDQEIQANHPDLELDDIRAAIAYAAVRVDDRIITLKSA